MIAAMEQIRGRASNVVASMAPASRHSEWFAPTTTFELGGRKVRFASRSGATLHDGDDVVVCGDVRDDVLQAVAYRNFTAGTAGGDAWSSAWLVVLMLAALSIASYGESGIVSIVLAIFAAYTAFRAGRIAAARRGLAAVTP